MNWELGAFALRQLLASAVVLGPILILIGLSYLHFKQDKKSIVLYIGIGTLLTLLGGVCLYSEFHAEKSVPPVQKGSMPFLR